MATVHSTALYPRINELQGTDKTAKAAAQLPHTLGRDARYGGGAADNEFGVFCPTVTSEANFVA